MDIEEKAKHNLMSKAVCINCKVQMYVRDTRDRAHAMCKKCEDSGARAAFERRNYFKNSQATVEQRANAIGRDKTVRWGGKTGFFDPGKRDR